MSSVYQTNMNGTLEGTISDKYIYMEQVLMSDTLEGTISDKLFLNASHYRQYLLNKHPLQTYKQIRLWNVQFCVDHEYYN